MKKVIVIISIIITCIVIGLVCFLILVKPKVVLNNNLKVEINSEVNNSYFIKEVKHGKLLNKDKEIDTTKLGSQEINVMIKCFLKKVNYKFSIEIVDTKEPIIEGLEQFETDINKEIFLNLK